MKRWKFWCMLLGAAVFAAGCLTVAVASEAAARGGGSADFVVRLYRTCLGREADVGGLDFWQERLETGRVAGADVAAGFFLSGEYLAMEKTPGQYVDDLYRAVLGREPDAAGQESWLDCMEAGGSRRLVLSGFTNSREFIGLCARYGVEPGSYTSPEIRDQNRKVTAFIQRMYRLVLRRDGEGGGLNSWASFLLERGGSGAEMVEGFMLSEEFRKREMDLADYVELLYRAVLGRESDPAGKAGWLEAVRAGRLTTAGLIGCFSESSEFRELCGKYGVAAGGGNQTGGDLANVRVFHPETVPEMQDWINRLRAEEDLPSLAGSEQMEALALRRAEEIAGDYSHEGHRGGENLAYSSGRKADPERIFERWADSPDHRENLTARGYRSAACAKYVTEQGTYWALVFGG